MRNTLGHIHLNLEKQRQLNNQVKLPPEIRSWKRCEREFQTIAKFKFSETKNNSGIKMKNLLIASVLVFNCSAAETLPKTQLINITVICPECEQLSSGCFIFDSKEPIYNASIQLHKTVLE